MLQLQRKLRWGISHLSRGSGIMTRSYFTEDAKMFKASTPRWSLQDCETIHKLLTEKGYITNCVSRVGCDRKYHDALQVQRTDIPFLIEQCFRQRLVVEVQAEGHGKASINFVYDYDAVTIIDAIQRFQRRKQQ